MQTEDKQFIGISPPHAGAKIHGAYKGSRFTFCGADSLAKFWMTETLDPNQVTCQKCRASWWFKELKPDGP